MDRNESNPYWAEPEHCHNFTRERLYTLLRQVGFDPCHYAVNARYVAGMEVIARKLTTSYLMNVEGKQCRGKTR